MVKKSLIANKNEQQKGPYRIDFLSVYSIGYLLITWWAFFAYDRQFIISIDPRDKRIEFQQ